jgi:membrane protein YqaA with SNARE-associated domain
MHSMDAWIESVKAVLALPGYGLGSLFAASFLSATLLPLGSEAVLYGVLKLNPSLLWPALLTATVGNTLGGAVTWWMGRGAEEVYERMATSPHHVGAKRWLTRFGPPACLLAWVPIVGDPLCAVAGWLRLPFWPCVFYMAVGKFLRYLTITTMFFGGS